MKIEMNYEELESIKKKARDEGYSQGYSAGYAAGYGASPNSWHPNYPYYWTSDQTTTAKPLNIDKTTITCGPSTCGPSVTSSTSVRLNTNENNFNATTASNNAVTSDNLDEKLREWLKQTIG